MTSPTDISASIERLGRETPDKVAVKFENETLTYADLNRALSSFASKLDRTISRNTPLPILAGVNLKTFVAIYSAMRAGIPFSAIDASNPPHAIDEILIELGSPRHIVIATEGANNYSSQNSTFIEVEYSNNVDFQPQPVDLSELGCIMFTSGSTGKPKGVMLDWSRIDAIKIDHARQLRETLKEIRNFGVHNSLAYLFGLKRSITVACGYPIALQDPLKFSSDELIAKLDEDEVSHIGFVPSFLEKICDSRSSGLKSKVLACVVLAGEGSTWDQVAKIKQLTDNDLEINTTYGASEIQYISLEYLLPSELGEGKIPFKRIVYPDRTRLIPISDDSSLFELYLYEPISTGYLNDPELTERKFGVDAEGRRFLRTGDLFRVLENGFYLHSGRADDLVKINGRLVEPSESERILRSIPGIDTAVVLPHLNEANKDYLVGHVKLLPASSLTPNEIYEILLSKLASNLVPSMLVRHSEIPLSDRGKVDRQYLIKGKWERWTVTSIEPTLSPTEVFAAKTLSEILAQPKLGLDEDLFGAGMDSFAALEFIAIAKEYGFESFTPNAFLKYRSVRSIALMLDTKCEKDIQSTLVLHPDGTNDPIFCFPGGGMTALWFRDFATELGTDQPLVIIEAHGLHSDDLPEKSIEEYSARALVEIQRIQPNGELHILGHSAGGTVAFAVSQLLRAQNREVMMISLDSHSVLEKLRVPISRYSFTYEIQRMKKLFTRPVKVNVSAINRRMNVFLFTLSGGRISKSQAKFDKFLLLAIKSLKNYVPTEPDFPIYLMYIKGTENFKLWETLPTLKTRLISGYHFNLLEQPHVQDVAQEALAWFSEKVPQVSQ